MFEITPDDIALLNDEDLRTLVGLLCEAEVRNRGLSATSVTWGGNQNAVDGGVDVRVDLPANTKIDGFVPRPSTGFQAKRTDMPRAAIIEEMRPHGVLRPVIKELAEKSGAYVIVSSAGSTSDSALQDRRDAMAEAVIDFAIANALTLDFYDRTRLATWVRDHPGLILWVRERVGKALRGWHPYGPWAFSPDGVNDEYLVDDAVCLQTGQKESEGGISALVGIKRIRDRLRGWGGIVRLVGLSGVGKTRLVQALFDSRVGEQTLDPSLAIYTNMADAPDPQPTALASDLIATKTRAILVIDNCTPELHRRLSELCRAPESAVSVLTVEYDIREDQPEGAEVFEMKPSSRELIEKLVRHRFPSLSPSDARRVTDVSGCNARVAIALAGAAGQDTIAALNDEELFQRLFWQRHQPNESLLLAAQAFSLVYSFHGEDVTHSDQGELVRLGALIGKDAQEMFRSVAELLRRDLAGNLYIADYSNNRIRKMTVATGEITTVAGSGTGCSNGSTVGDGCSATSGKLVHPEGVAVDGAGNIYIADVDDNLIRVVNPGAAAITIATVSVPAGAIETVAGNGTRGYNTDGVLATTAELDLSEGVAVDVAGNIYIGDTWNNRIRVVGSGAPTPTLSVAPTPNPSTYGTSVTFTATISSGPTGTVTFYDGVSAIGTGAISGTTATLTTSTLAVGGHSITASYAANPSYNAVTSSAIIQTVNPATPTITWATPAAITYGTALSGAQLDAMSSVAGAFTYGPVPGTVLSAGTQALNVTLTPTDATDYTTATATVSLTVNQAPLTVTAQNASRAYGTANPAFSDAISGFVNGDTQSAISGMPNLNTTATISSAAGTYPIIAGLGTLLASNYTFSTFVSGTLTINAIPSGDFVATNGQMQASRYGQTATQLSTGQILVAGGMSPSGVANSAELYTLASRTFAATSNPMSVSRWLQTATLLNDGTVLIAGGSDLANEETLDTAEIYNPTAGTFTLLANTLNTARVGHTATLLNSGQVLIVGGYDPDYGLISDAELYDPPTQTFIDLGNTNAPRYGHTATVLPNGQVLIAGGDTDPTPSAALNTAEIFDEPSQAFTPVSVRMTSPREGHAAVLLNSGQVLITGGDNPPNGSLNSAELYDLPSGTFTPTTSTMIEPRISHVMTLLNGGKVLIEGGVTDSAGSSTALR